jgi:hypothetical protein
MVWKPTVRAFEVPPATAEWDFTITHDDYNNILPGFNPRNMDDKWTAVADPPDEQGNTVLHFYLGGRNHEEYALTLTPGKLDPNGDESKDWGSITKIAWKEVLPGGSTVSEKEAKSSAISLCNYVLDCKIEKPEHLKTEDDYE